MRRFVSGSCNMLRKVLRSGPAHRRHSSIIESSAHTPEQDRDQVPTTIGSFQRLSLKFTHSNDDPFASWRSEPSEVEEEKPIHPAGILTPQPPPEVDSKIEETSQGEHDESNDLSALPVKPQRFSLLRLRHASDPQLSTTYKSQAKDQDVVAPRALTYTASYFT